MANISIRNLQDSVKQALRRRAADEGCSLEEFLRRCLAQAAEQGQSSAQAEQARVSAAAPQAGMAAAGALDALRGKVIVLIIGGSVAAYKAPELIRLLRRAGAAVRVIMTAAAQQFITPLAVGAVAGGRVYSDLFMREEEHDVGHIRLARQADIVLAVAVSASRMAKMAAGQGDDLAGAVLLASRAPILLAPAMNPAMWAHPALQRNLAQLKADGCLFIGPERGEMAESDEAGLGRMSEPAAIAAAAAAIAAALPQKQAEPQAAGQGGAHLPQNLPLKGRHILVTSGPTYEAIDPVRYLTNHSSGKQGHAIAAASKALGARVSLISGPVALPDPEGVEVARVVSAREMLAAVQSCLPADAAVFVAAVADWRPQRIAADKIKKAPPQTTLSEQGETRAPMQLALVENPDILASIGHSGQRPRLVIGFAAETADLLSNAKAKLAKKGADWIFANNVGAAADGSSVMGGDSNRVYCVSRDGVEDWPPMAKTALAARLAEKIAAFLHKTDTAAKKK